MSDCIYLLRHGHVSGGKPRRFLGQADVELSEQGKQQAIALKSILEPVHFSQIFSSPLMRARQTAELATGLSCADIQIVEQFREIDLGRWEGLTVAEIQHRYPGQYEARGKHFDSFCPEDGESFQDLQKRVLKAFEPLATHSMGNILIVAHAGVNRVILSHLQKSPLQDLLTIPQEYCAINILRKASPHPVILSVNGHSIVME
ncbi:alpha-ribazole phosphatase [Desulfogranum japonicum]|uniref:alpha-ribazole phosphatase n=1 Tax=Desulfogranum japonicum TaxID=231447 RepID=UPI00040CABB1|nr:alpha-ribazole phosphatase [Desulfogranum japonicum]